MQLAIRTRRESCCSDHFAVAFVGFDIAVTDLGDASGGPSNVAFDWHIGPTDLGVIAVPGGRAEAERVTFHIDRDRQLFLREIREFSRLPLTGNGVRSCRCGANASLGILSLARRRICNGGVSEF